MEISYRREIKYNYLVVTPDMGAEAGYEAKMLAGNEIRGLMHMHIRYQDGTPLYYYDITSRQPLSRLLETRSITRDEICQIVIQLHVTLMRMEEYLLSDGGILLNQDLIYVEPELFGISLCLVPGHRGDFPEQLSRFLQYILKCVNHKDRECVVLAYGMYQESLKDNYGIEDILKFISLDGENRDGTSSQELSGQGQRQPEGGNGWGNQTDWVKQERKGEKNSREGTVDFGTADFGTPDIGMSDSEWSAGFGRASGFGGALGFGKKAGAGWEESPGQKECNRGYERDNRKKIPIAKQVIIWMSVVVLIPAALWLLRGPNAVRELRFILICGDGGLLFAIAAMDLAFWLVGGRKKGRNEQMREIQPVQEAVKPRRQKDEADEGMWRILYEDESDPLSGTDQRTSGEDETMNACSGKQPVEYSNTFPGHDNEETMRTTLLTGRRTEDELRRLTSIEGEDDEIVISYYPFVIGKNKNLADYVLQKDTVSRFHLRIDKDGGTYTVTDLNSTNGTRVRGKLLDANETAVIEVGDEIIIADIGYIFT